ncbi:MAG: AMP-binding protein [bacterium]
MNEKLINLLDFVSKNNHYYSSVLKDFKGNFEDIPFLTRQDIYEHGYSGDKTLVSRGMKVGYIFSTGGTTGKPKYIGYSFQEFETVCQYLVECYRGIDEQDLVANLFMAGNMWASFLFVSRALEKIGCSILPIAGNTDLMLTKFFISNFRPNCIVGIPTQIVNVFENDWDFVRKIYYAGENFLPQQIEFFKSRGCIIYSGGYASVDADIIGFQCSNIPIPLHHIFTSHQIVEIIDIDTGKPITELNQVGEIVVTNLDRYLCPIIRYRTGDLGKWVKSSCGCNLPTIELIGRYDDWIRLASFDFYYQDFAYVFYPYPITLVINKQDSLVTVLVQSSSEISQKQIHEYIELLKNRNWQLKEGIESNLIKVQIKSVSQLPSTNKKINVIYE